MQINTVPSVQSALKLSIFRTWVKQLFAVIKMGRSTRNMHRFAYQTHLDHRWMILFKDLKDQNRLLQVEKRIVMHAMNKETIGAFCTCNECLRSKVLWGLKVVKSHYSFCSCNDVQKLFSEMSRIPKLQNSFLVAKRSVHIYVILVLHHILNSC